MYAVENIKGKHSMKKIILLSDPAKVSLKQKVLL